MADNPNERALLSAVGIAIGCGALAFLTFAAAQPQTVDDMFILLVHAKHLALNGGIYWNARDGHLDGATSFLDLVLKALAIRLSGDGVRAAFEITRGLMVIIPAVGVAVLRKSQPGRWIPAGLAGLLLATNPALAEGSAYLLETPLYVLTGLLLVGTFLAARSFGPRLMAVLCFEAILVALTRPEGALPGALVLVAATRDPNRSQTRSWWSVIAFGAVLTAYYGWHVAYFGSWAPNTYYAKTSAVRLHEIEDGFGYVAGYARTWTGALTLVPVLAVLASVRAVPRERRFLAAVLAGTIAIVLAGVVWGGGDSYTGGRFLALPTALGALGLSWLSQVAVEKWRRALLAVAVLVVGGQSAAVVLARSNIREHLTKWPLSDATYVCMAQFAQAVDRAVPGGSLAETDFQNFKYFADDMEVIDLYGLSDREIAHRAETGHVRWGKLDLHDVLRRQPDAFLWGTTPYRNRAMSAVSMQKLMTDLHTHRYFTRQQELPAADIAAGLAASYLPASVPFCGKQYNVFIRDDDAAKFAQAGFAVGGK